MHAIKWALPCQHIHTPSELQGASVQSTTASQPLRPLSYALSSTLSSSVQAKPKEPPDFSLSAQPTVCAVDVGAAVEAAPCLPSVYAAAGWHLGQAVGWVRIAPQPGGRESPPSPPTTTAKPNTACKMRISCLFPVTVCGELLPFHYHSRKKSSGSDLRTHCAHVGGFVHFW